MYIIISKTSTKKIQRDIASQQIKMDYQEKKKVGKGKRNKTRGDKQKNK